eukprot:1508579-Rhodomonas_salina.2
MSPSERFCICTRRIDIITPRLVVSPCRPTTKPNTRTTSEPHTKPQNERERGLRTLGSTLTSAAPSCDHPQQTRAYQSWRNTECKGLEQTRSGESSGRILSWRSLAMS